MIVIPMTSAMIEAVECLEKADGITSHLLQDKDRIGFYDSISITGVDHNKNNSAQYDNIFRDPDYIKS
jgi:hypothetical protein